MIKEIQIPVSPEARATIQALDNLPAEALQTIRQVADEQLELTVGRIQARKLSRRGPQTLGVRTNRLRSSVRPTKATISGQTVTGIIGSNVEYLGVHEFGFDADVQVRAFTRRYTRRPSGHEFVFTYHDTKPGKMSKVTTKKVKAKAETIDVQVRAHTRHMKFPARAPLATGIAERAPATGKALSEAVLRLFP